MMRAVTFLAFAVPKLITVSIAGIRNVDVLP